MHKIFNIPLCNSFLDEISKILLAEVNQNSQALQNYLILLPNHRLIKNLQYAFLKNSRAKSLILPKMVSIANLNYFFEDVHILSKQELDQLHYDDFFKNTISFTHRSFILAKLIRQKDNNLSINRAIALAQQLGEIIDKGYQQNIDFKQLDKIIDVNLAKHWQEIIKFLDIATTQWQNILTNYNMVDAVYMQHLIYKIQNKLWEKSPPCHPVIGIHTQSYFHDITKLNGQIIKFPQGRLFFYGLDKNLINQDVKISHTHPQKIFHHTIKELNIKPNQINFLLESEQTKDMKNKEKFIHNIFDNHITKVFSKNDINKITQNMSIITTKNEEDEAQSIALILRETLETPNKTAGVICNNPNLIVRIKNALLKWGININNYSGESLHHSLQAKLFILVGNVINENFEFNSLLSLLKHPFVKFDLTRAKVMLLSQQLDKLILREPSNDSGIANLYNLINKQLSNPYQQLHKEQLQDLYGFIQTIEKYFSDFINIAMNTTKQINVSETLAKHIKLTEQISLNEENKSDAWTYQEGKTLSLLLADLLEQTQDLENMYFNEYLHLLNKLISQQDITQIYNKHPRLFIYGNLQSTGISHDTMILSNVNEEELPSKISHNIWLNKYLMNSIGLIDEDHIIGLQAQIFSQVLGAQTTILIRSEKNQGNLTSPTRWLLKMQTTLKAYQIHSLNKHGHIEEFIKILDKPNNITPLNNLPTITCHNQYKPLNISATKIEALIQNPYIFFIRYILKLVPLNNINPKMDEAMFGTTIHKILEIYMENIHKYKNQDVDAQINIIYNIANTQLDDYKNSIKFTIFKLPLIRSTLKKFILHQQDNFQNLDTCYLETQGNYNISLNHDITITLSGTADRIDINKNGNALIIDYKTSANNKVNPYQRQLKILSLILHKQGFNNITNDINVINATYIFLPKQMDKEITIKDMYGLYNITDTYECVQTFELELTHLLQGYYINNHPFNWTDNKNIHDNYLHFARYMEFNSNFIDTMEEENNDINNIEEE